MLQLNVLVQVVNRDSDEHVGPTVKLFMLLEFWWRPLILLLFHLFMLLSGWCWSHRKEDYCGHLRRMGGTWGRRFLWEGLHKGGPLSCLCRPLGGKVSGEIQTVPEGPGAGWPLSSSSDIYSLCYCCFFPCTLAGRFNFYLCVFQTDRVWLRPLGGVCDRSRPPIVHLLVHVWLRSEEWEGAAADRQQKLWPETRHHRQVLILNSWHHSTMVGHV